MFLFGTSYIPMVNVLATGDVPHSVFGSHLHRLCIDQSR